MLSLRQNCRDYGSNHIVKNGIIHNKKPSDKCLSCGRQFVENPTNKVISSQTKDLIDRLLLEKIYLAGRARTTDVYQKWLQDYVNNKYSSIERIVKVKPQKKVRLNVDCDELWSFVDSQQNKQWVWLAMDRETREIIGVYIGALRAFLSKTIMEFSTSCISTMRCLLYRFLAGLCLYFSKQTP